MKEKAKAKKQLGAELQNVKRGVARPKEDTAEHKLAEENTRRLATVVRDSNDAITIQDFEGRITAWNHGAELMYGYSEAEALQMNIGHLTPPEKQAEQKEFTRRLKAGETISSFETQRVNKEGRILDVWLTVTKLVDDGKAIGIVSTERDVTERKRAEEEIRESEEKLRITFESITEAIVITDALGNIVQTNEAATRMTGYSREEIIGKSGLDLIDKKYHDMAVQTMVKVSEEGRGMENMELQFLTKDGRYVDAEFGTAMIRDISGNPAGFVSIARDITERKKTEEALRESEERWRSLVTNVPDIIINLDREHRIMFISRTVAGFRAEDVIGKSIYDFTSPEYHDVIKMSIEKVFKTGEMVNYETLGSGAEGKPAWYSTRIGPVESAGEVVSVLLISNDITERKRAEEALRESEQKLRNTFESAYEGIMVTDPMGNIIEANENVLHVHGYKSKEELFRINSIKLISKKDRARLAQNSANAIKEGHSFKGEYSLLKADGTEFEAECRMSVLYDSAGKPVGLVGVSHDITDRKQAEEERERLLKSLEEKTKELEQVLYAASHDLRSPLVNIQGFAKEMEQSVQQMRSVLKIEDIPNTVREQLSAPLNEDIPSALQYIHASAYKIDSLLGGLLQLSRLGRAELDIKRLNMNKLMESVIHTFEYSIKERGVKLEVGDLPPCLGDETRINQLFSNLIDNALKFLDPDRPGIIKINGTKEDKQAVYCVEDNGIGIAPEYHEKVFEIFERLNPTAGTGEGLGLTIVRMIVDRHNGRIWLESEPGKGSRFFVSLPAA